MGTNFYIRVKDTNGKAYKGPHIGKRSAAGEYCWDCGVTLCEDGNDAIHLGRSDWHDKCPKCGKEPVKESLTESTGGIELGFNKVVGPKTGVSTCSSFTWGVDPDNINNLEVVDEYNRVYSPNEFKVVLAGCPVQFMNWIGQEFF